MADGTSLPATGPTTAEDDPAADLLDSLGRLAPWGLAAGGTQIVLSPGAAAMLGLAAGAHPMGAVMHVLDASAQTALADLIQTGQGDLVARLAAPADRLVRLTLWPGGDGAIQDLTDLAVRDAEYRTLRSRHTDFAAMSDEWLWEMDASLSYTYMSPRIEEITNLSVAYHIGKTRRDLIGDKNESLEMEMHLAWLDQHRAFRDFRYWRLGPDGEQRYLSVTGKPLFDAAGTFLGYRGIGRDLTGQQEIREALLQVNRQLNAANKAKSDAMASLKEANALLEERNADMERVQEEIRHTALHDPLTGLANRRYLDDHLAEAAARCKTGGQVLGLLHVDLDRFKQINDTLGHAAGDAVLVHVAAVLRETAHGHDFVARVGGDEFVIVSIGRDETALRRLSETIIDRLSRALVFEGRECWFGSSIGIATMQGTEIDAGKILSNADIALYRAKRGGRGRHEVFSRAVQHEILHHKALTDGIQAGLERREFLPWYQPQIAADTFDVCGLEALARWRHPDGTLRPPVAFLDVAEELSAVSAIDRMILERALDDLRRWDKDGLGVPKLSVNVSARRLVERDLTDSLRRLDPPRGRLAFELLESVFLDDLEDAITWNIYLLREMGIEIELDDFGSGHASIISLVKLAPDAIKIDREMTSAIVTDPARRSLAESIIGIGKTLGVRVIAEGVETREQADLLCEMGCDALQGYFIAHPMPAEEIPAFLSRWRDDRLPDLYTALG